MVSAGNDLMSGASSAERTWTFLLAVIHAEAALICMAVDGAITANVMAAFYQKKRAAV
jgi:hypothetical protein